MLQSNNSAALIDVADVALGKRGKGAEDKNRNGRFYVYFASLLPELIPSIEGLGSAPNIWNSTYIP